jgi:protein-S-isoprenylcysteine O-methyltransferase Ste14
MLFFIFLFIFSHHYLNKNWNVPALNHDSVLVENGPYSVIRHPIYLVMIYFSIYISLIAMDLIIFFVQIVIIIYYFNKIFDEENILMISLQGYKSYMLNKKRLIPFIY